MNFKEALFSNIKINSSLLMVIFFASCASVKNYQPNKPFIYSNKIVVIGNNVTKDEKKRLTIELENYWDDSLRARKVTKFGLFSVIKTPPIFDTVNVTRTKRFMTAYLNSQGYYYSTISDSLPVKIDTVKNQYRAKVELIVNLGKNITIDSVAYSFIDTLHKTSKDSLIQKIALQQYNNSLLKKGQPYTKQKISDELDRLVSWFRQNGYYRFTREYVYALVDTANEKLFKLTLDPIELLKLIEEAEKKKKENPAWDISIKQRAGGDSTKLNRFYINRIYFYPESKLTDSPDSLMKQKWRLNYQNKEGDLFLRANKGLFKFRPLIEHTFLRKDSLYHEDAYLKTINTFSKISAWQQVDARIIQTTKDSLDVHFFLMPQKKYQTTYNLEGSRNSGDFTAGNLLGISLSAGLNNRNVWKQAIQSSTNLRGGIELNLAKQSDTTKPNLIQTLQFSLSHSYSFPRLIMPKAMANLGMFKNADNKRTIVAASIAYTERLEIFKLRSANISMGYEGQQKNGDVYLWKPINIELYSLDTIFTTNQFIRNSFNSGNVVGFGLGSINFTRTRASTRKLNNSHLLRFGFEESGLATSFIKSFENNIYRFIKLEGEYRFTQKKQKSEFAYRAFAGIGISLSGQSLPFFKQYFAGGPNSMRAWGLRQLGLGSSVASDTVIATNFRDRFGDMQLETNLEYRFNIATISGFKIGSALFTDIGNIWNLKKDINNPNAEFSFNRLYKDLAISVGTGLRMDFSYFLIRFDFAYKVKDPGRLNNNGWMSFKDFVWTEQRNNTGKTEIRNYAFQLGIGLPF